MIDIFFIKYDIINKIIFIRYSELLFKKGDDKMKKSTLIIFITSLIGIFMTTNSFCAERYRGRIEPDIIGNGADIYLEKDKEPLDFLKRLLEMDDLINKKENEAEKLRIEREKLKIEREKLRILQQQIEIQNRRPSGEENKIQSNKKELNNQSDDYRYFKGNYITTMDHYNTSPTIESSGPMQVYFNNGKTVTCDKVWQDGDTIYIVHHGKKFAVGYDKSEIDMSKSFK
jgi:hypothetical protein